MKKILLLVFISVFTLSKANDLIVENIYHQSFKKAYSLYPSVPKGILEAVAYTQSRFNHLSDNTEPSCIGLPRTYGIMGLIADGKNYFRNNLQFVSDLSGFTEEDIKRNPETSIIAYAAAFSEIQKQVNNYSKNPADYKLTLIALSELPMRNDNLMDDYVMNVHLYQLFWFLNKGEFQDAYGFPDYHLNLSEIFGDNYSVLSSSSVKISKTSILSNNGSKYNST